jgi:hypothetical protein
MQENNKGQQLEVTNYLSKGNKFVFYIYRRISKVSEAIYIVTDIIKDAEPLKWALRKSAAEAASLRHFLDEHSVFNNLEKSLLELESMLAFASVTKVLSSMNAAILQDQIKLIMAEIKESSQGSGFATNFGQGFFDIPKPVPALESHKGHNVLYDFYAPTASKSNPISRQKVVQVGNEDKGQRRERILKIIRNKGAVTIKDITDQIKDCSEKTIQRELTFMVISGLLKKTGERRWSRYSVV